MVVHLIARIAHLLTKVLRCKGIRLLQRKPEPSEHLFTALKVQELSFKIHLGLV